MSSNVDDWTTALGLISRSDGPLPGLSGTTGQWLLDGEPVDAHVARVLDLAREYDEHTSELKDTNTISDSRHGETHWYACLTFRDCTELAKAVGPLEDALEQARAGMGRALEVIEALNEPTGADAAEVERRFALHLRTVEGEWDRHCRRHAHLLRQCEALVASRGQEVGSLRRRQQDLESLNELDELLQDALSNARSAADAARRARSTRGEGELG